jgi:hypothetical protein
MKTIKQTLMVAALAMAPVITNAQWSAVRYDQHNTFTKVFAATANDVFVIGVDRICNRSGPVVVRQFLYAFG